MTADRDPDLRPLGHTAATTVTAPQGGLWPALWAFAATIAILAMGYAIGIGGVAIGLAQTAVLGQPLPPMASGLAGMLVAQSVIIAATWAAAGRYGGLRRQVLALEAPHSGLRGYAVGIAVFSGFIALSIMLQVFLIRTDPMDDLRPFVDLVRGPYWLLTVLVIGIGAPLSEELLFRGFLLPALAASRVGAAGAAVASSLMWASLHWGYTIVGLVEIFAMGLVFAWLLGRTGSIRVGLCCHALYNLALIAGLRYGLLPV